MFKAEYTKTRISYIKIQDTFFFHYMCAFCLHLFRLYAYKEPPNKQQKFN